MFCNYQEMDYIKKNVVMVETKKNRLGCAKPIL